MSNGEILKIRPDIYQAMLLDDILHTLRDNSELLGDIVKKLDAIIPEGILENIKDLNITAEPVNLLVKTGLGSGWHSISITNDGVNNVYCAINSSRPFDKVPHKIKPSETYEVDFRAAKINLVHLYTDSGVTSTVRISAKR
uniref:Uncharacterized protein n=1 Tax=viral metagenome TaxID=1070528 RepID=A0A6H1ZNB5_9ZZZZ